MIKWLVPLLLLVSFEAIADIVAKYFSLTNKMWIGLGALGLYIIANVFWLFALKNGAQLTTGAILFSLLSQLFAVGIGFFMFKEQVTNLQWIGIVLGIIAVGFLLWE